MTGRKKIGIVLSCVAVLIAGYLTLRGLEDSDRRHQRFYNSGKTINGFLSSYCDELEMASESGDVTGLLALYAGGYHSPGRGRVSFGEEQPLGDVMIRRSRAEGTEDFGPPELAGEVTGYLAGIRTLEHTICKIDLIEEIEPEANARLTVKLIFDGIDTRGRAFQDRFFYRWVLDNEAAGGGEKRGVVAGSSAEGNEAGYGWKITLDQLVEGIRVAGDRRGLVEVEAVAAGIDYVHRRNPRLDMKRYRSELKFGIIQHASGGISAADYDRDGRPDLFFLDGERCRLYRNLGTAEDGSLRFRDVTAEVGLDGIGRAHVGLFADFDNDGDRDLFVGRYLAPNLYFRNHSEKGGGVAFRDASREMGLSAVMPTSSATLLDYDRDGFVDLYVGVYGNAFEALPRLPFYATNGGPNRLYRNDGGQRLVDVTERGGVGDTGWSLAVAAGDYDGDGWPDLAVANDFGRKSLYRNLGPDASGAVTFTEVAKEAGVLDFSGGMGLAFGDFDDDGRPDLYTSNINSNQRWFGEDMTVNQYMRNISRSRWAVLDAAEYWALYRLIGADWVALGQQIGEGNSLFRNAGDGTFEELKDSHTERTGWGWSVAFLDLDNDSDLDLYTANGWISNTPGTDL